MIAGDSHGVTGAVTRDATAPLYLDLHLPAGTRFVQPLPVAHNAFVYAYRGDACRLPAPTFRRGRMAILKNEADGVVIEAMEDARGDPGRRAAAGRTDRADTVRS